jgi:hypothetical protein
MCSVRDSANQIEAKAVLADLASSARRLNGVNANMMMISYHGRGSTVAPSAQLDPHYL